MVAQRSQSTLASKNQGESTQKREKRQIMTYRLLYMVIEEANC